MERRTTEAIATEAQVPAHFAKDATDPIAEIGVSPVHEADQNQLNAGFAAV